MGNKAQQEEPFTISPQTILQQDSNHKFMLLSAAQLSKYNADADAGLWVHHNAAFLQADYLISNINLYYHYTRMENILPAVDGSIVCEFYDYSKNKSSVAHISGTGQLLKQLNIGRSRPLWVGMLTPGLVLMVQGQQQKREIVQWDLQTYVRISFAYPSIILDQNWLPYSQLDKQRGRPFIFGETKMFCCWWSTLQKNKIQLAYFKYPLKSHEDKPCWLSQITLPENSQDFRFVKLNNASMVGWVLIKNSSSEPIPIVIFEFSGNKQESQTIYIKGQPEIVTDVIVSDIWKIRDGIIFLQLSFVRIDNCKQVSQVIKQNDLIWNYKQGHSRSAKFNTKGYHQIQVLGQFRKLYQIPFYFYHPYLQVVRKIAAPSIYYVDMFTEQVMAIEKAGNYEKRDLFACFDSNPQLQYCFKGQWKEKTQIQIKVRKVTWPKIQMNLVVAFLLGNMIKQCDDDLIYQVIRLIEASQE